MPWYRNVNDVHALARHLILEGVLDTPLAVAAFYEKPWKWETEYQAHKDKIPRFRKESQ